MNNREINTTINKLPTSGQKLVARKKQTTVTKPLEQKEEKPDFESIQNELKKAKEELEMQKNCNKIIVKRQQEAAELLKKIKKEKRETEEKLYDATRELHFVKMMKNKSI